MAAVVGGVLRGLGKPNIGAMINSAGYYAVGLPIGLFLTFSSIQLGVVSFSTSSSNLTQLSFKRLMISLSSHLKVWFMDRNDHCGHLHSHELYDLSRSHGLSSSHEQSSSKNVGRLRFHWSITTWGSRTHKLSHHGLKSYPLHHQGHIRHSWPSYLLQRLDHRQLPGNQLIKGTHTFLSLSPSSYAHGAHTYYCIVSTPHKGILFLWNKVRHFEILVHPSFFSSTTCSLFIVSLLNIIELLLFFCLFFFFLHIHLCFNIATSLFCSMVHLPSSPNSGHFFFLHLHLTIFFGHTI